MTKIRLLVLAGGESDEHEVSITSARSLLQAVADSDLDATALVITRDGRWLTPSESQKALTQGRATQGGELTLHRAQVAQEFDVVFPLVHGPHGEDGTIQGMLELAGMPYVGSGVLASALCMDKPMARVVLSAHHLPQLPHSLVTRHHYQTDPEPVVAACLELESPWFIKPANLGSSVGISKACTQEELRDGLDLALQYDRRAIVEPAAEGARELEVGILGNDTPRASSVGEITYDAEFYDYHTKYTDGEAALHIPAAIDEELAARIRRLGLEAFRALDCAGFARVDFFYLPDSGMLYLNELNTIPGFTPLSMYTKLWEHAGVPYPVLVKTLVELARERHALRRG